jgi:hypothetical protein
MTICYRSWRMLRQAVCSAAAITLSAFESSFVILFSCACIHGALLEITYNTCRLKPDPGAYQELLESQRIVTFCKRSHTNKELFARDRRTIAVEVALRCWITVSLMITAYASTVSRG